MPDASERTRGEGDCDSIEGKIVSGDIRLAVAEDVTTIEALIARSIRALHAGSYGDDVIEEAIAHAYGVDWQLVRDRTYFVVEAQSQVVGAGGWSYRQTLAGARGPDGAEPSTLDPLTEAARIRAFYIDPTFARQGLGRQLLQASETAALQAGFTAAELTATLPAITFYAAAGYRSIGPYDMGLPNGSVLHLRLMRKDLR